MRKITLDELLLALTKKNYKIFYKPYELNIVGIRSTEKKVNFFNDTIIVAYKDDKGTWNMKQYAATTKPGIPWLRKLMNPKGTAILVPGQYEDAWQFGMHKNKYQALVQAKSVSVYRDNNLNDIIELDPKTIDTGLFGINIHRANAFGLSAYVGEHSAGCQVIRDPKEFDEFIDIVKKSRIYKHKFFTYTLINEDEIIS